MIFGQLRKDGELRIRKRVQVLVEVEVEAGTYAINPHRTGLWHKAPAAANAPGHDRKGSQKSFGALGADPP